MPRKPIKKHRQSADIDARMNFSKFLEEFEKESDRAAVILGAAKLDYLLFQILNKFLAPDVTSKDELLENGPLSTFSAKINLCSRLKLIDPNFTRALHLTRKIRNSFAHEATGCNLDSGPYRDRINELISPISNYAEFYHARDAFFKEHSPISANFFTALAIMVIRLDFLFREIEQIETVQSLSFKPPSYKTDIKKKKKKKATTTKKVGRKKTITTKGST